MSVFFKLSKKALVLIIPLILIFFTGCFGGGDEEGTPTDSEIANFVNYDTSLFSISKPQDWIVVEPKDFSNNIPEETLIIFRHNVLDDQFTPNANVTRKTISAEISSYDFAKNEINTNRNTLLNYKEISRDEEFNIVIGGQLQKTVLVLFEGKQNETEPTIRIIQTYAVKGNEAYTATGAYLAASNDVTVTNAKNIVKSFKVF